MISKVSYNSSNVVAMTREVQVTCFSIAALLYALLTLAPPVSAQATAGQVQNYGIAYSGTMPYNGKTEDAFTAAAQGTTIPMASFTFTARKDGLDYTDMIVGTNPFVGPKTTTEINVVLVPVIVQIGTTTFDPTVNDPCIGPHITPLAALQQSPIFQNVVFDGQSGDGHAATMNGVNVGTTSYTDAFRRAEFWSKVAGTNYHTTFRLTTAPPWTITAAEVESLGGGNVQSTGCALIGILPTSSFQNYIANTVIPAIPAITPTTFALFLMTDVVTTTSSALNCLNGCEIGYHGAFGTPPRTYVVSEYDSTENFWIKPGTRNLRVMFGRVRLGLVTFGPVRPLILNREES
jgi:hypothetical protein